MQIPSGQEATVAFLMRLAGSPPVETHISLVFVGRDTVWKVKKAVELPFLDFTSVESRHRFTARELELNAAAAPGLYRGVSAVVRHDSGTLLLADAPADASVIDWVLRMAPVPPENFLDAIAESGGLTPPLQDAVADAVVSYHQGLPPLSDVLPPMRQIAMGNVSSAISAGLPESNVRDWRDRVIAALDAVHPLLARRAVAGLVRRAHGDLHLGNLCLWQGRPVPFDALEFDETLATIDLAYDLAFLLMDLDRQANCAAANRVLNRYIARTGDVELAVPLLPFLSVRAMVRAHVLARGGRSVAWQPYLSAALNYLRPVAPLVVAVGGLPGSGKSTLARGLAPHIGCAPGAVILRSDEIRKRLHGFLPEQRLPQSAYAEASTQAVLTALVGGVSIAARGGHSVVVDSTFSDLAQRRAVEAVAEAAGARFVGFWLDAPLGELERRVTGRSGDASDATVAVLRAAANKRPAARSWHALASRRPEDDLATALRALGAIASDSSSQLRRRP